MDLIYLSLAGVLSGLALWLVSACRTLQERRDER